MVATEEDDRLWGIFIKDLNNVDIEEDGKIKAQRLNVGFSRARETMHFVLSKPIEMFNGSIGDALRHYQEALILAQKEPSVAEVDKNSPMERKVLEWIEQTSFWKINFPSKILFKPQFELGKYLKDLDRTYNHPKYKVDFLLVYKEEINKEHKIIIEYDGFREHFKKIDGVNEFNYQDYYTDADVYREKVLESYGYKFLHINKFNVGKDPVLTLNKRLENIINNRPDANGLINHIFETVDGLQNGDMKECPKCKKIKSLNEFSDANLVTGYGRFCRNCKGLRDYAEPNVVQPVENVHANIKQCPKCGSRMVLKNGRYGGFYSCSRFPYCKGSRSL